MNMKTKLDSSYASSSSQASESIPLHSPASHFTGKTVRDQEDSGQREGHPEFQIREHLGP